MKNSLLWTALSNECVSISGLPFTQGHSWQRFTEQQLIFMPEAVCAQARFAAGAKIAFFSDSCDLSIRLSAMSPYKNHGIDVLADGQLLKTLHCKEAVECDINIVTGLAPKRRLFELYLPQQQALAISAIGIEADTALIPVTDKAIPPIVFYGSSVVQGVGAGLSSMNYPAILSRKLNVDVINFGFSGAGRGDPSVIDEIVKVAASCFVLDLGKSFGKQPAAVYRSMLKTVSQAHPDKLILAITPIFCTREYYNLEFAEFSSHLRSQVTQACEGIPNVTIVNGLDLLCAKDWGGLCNDGLHPNEYGYQIIAERLIRYFN